MSNTTELKRLEKLFENNFDCYTMSSICDDEMAMTKDKFIEVVMPLMNTRPEPTKGDYHEGLQEGIAIGRKEALATLKSSVGLVKHLSYHKNWHPLAGEVEAIIDGCEYRGQDSKYCSAKIVDHIISHISTITTKQSEGATVTPTETASDGKVKILDEDEAVIELNSRVCFSCGSTNTNTFRHPRAKIWCNECSYVNRDEGSTHLNTRPEPTLKSSEWVETKECPECGCRLYVNKNLLGEGFRLCKACKQEWWTDVNYKPKPPKGAQ